MKTRLIATGVALCLGLASTANAQGSPPVGGPDAKGNAPLKHAHTVNDGSAKPGANSFTEGQARQHILNSGYTGVTGLAKGQDGVWRGTASKGGAAVAVAMDFKGNVTEAAPPAGGASAGAAAMGGGSDSASASPMATKAESSTTPSMSSEPHHHHAMHHHRRHHRGGACANPGPNGAACSGESTLQNGVSDKETRAMQAGAHP